MHVPSIYESPIGEDVLRSKWKVSEHAGEFWWKKTFARAKKSWNDSIEPSARFWNQADSFEPSARSGFEPAFCEPSHAKTQVTPMEEHSVCPVLTVAVLVSNHEIKTNQSPFPLSRASPCPHLFPSLSFGPRALLSLCPRSPLLQYFGWSSLSYCRIPPQIYPLSVYIPSGSSRKNECLKNDESYGTS